MKSAHISVSFNGERIYSDRPGEDMLFDGMTTDEKATAAKLMGEDLVRAANSRLNAPKGLHAPYLENTTLLTWQSDDTKA